MKTELLVTVGVGGVGKTTVSAALALALAKQGRRTLVITIDPSKRLAQELGLDPQKTAPQAVSGLPLFGLVPDIQSTFDRMIRRFASSEEKAQKILSTSIYQHMTRTLIGTQEYMSLEILHQHLTSGEWQAIVLDTPPSKHVVDFFEAPKRFVDFFGGPSARWMARFAKGTQVIVKALTLLWGGQFLSDLAGFFSNLEGFFEGFSARATELRGILKSSDCRLLFVTTPQRYALSETQQFKTSLGALGFQDPVMILNRVLDLPGSEEEVVERLKQVGLDRDTILEWKKGLSELIDLMAYQKKLVQKLQLSGSKVVRLPQVDYEITSRQGLEHLSHELHACGLFANA